MRVFALLGLLLLSGCLGVKESHIVKGPQGYEVEVKEHLYGATVSNTVEIWLRLTVDGKKVKIFSGSGGYEPKAIFVDDRQLIIQYCFPEEYTILSEVYAPLVGRRHSSLEISAITVDSSVGRMIFCHDQGETPPSEQIKGYHLRVAS